VTLNCSVEFFSELCHVFIRGNSFIQSPKQDIKMRKADLVNKISDKTGIAKVDVLVALESFFKEVKETLKNGENVYVRGFGSFIVKKRRQKIGRIISRNEAIVIPEHFIPAFKPAKTFMQKVKNAALAKK